jgi:hypothetical protein
MDRSSTSTESWRGEGLTRSRKSGGPTGVGTDVPDGDPQVGGAVYPTCVEAGGRSVYGSFVNVCTDRSSTPGFRSPTTGQRACSRTTP